MGYYADTGSTSEQEPFPAYGPVDSLLSFAMFYVFVGRATPTIVDVITDAIPAVSPSGVGFAIAAMLWFIFVVTLVDMARRQYEALASRPTGESEQNFHRRSVPDTPLFVVYAAVVVVGGVVAAWTFERAVDAGITMIRIAGTLDGTLFDPVEFVVMVIFFITFGGAVRALDRIVVGGFRAMLSV
ncbi:MULTISPECIES: hypothetical protein [Haloferax]|uniref:hypothetical protein n=1 Tax=Haloferax TaxID=2251 RepID=UPI001CD9DF78|nr:MULTISPECIES: hypothetical protein [Haloferax]